jgi:Arylsulfotransferase (ASST)
VRHIALFFVLLLGACGGPAPVEEAPPADKKPEGGPPPWMLTAAEQPRGLLKNEPGASPGYVMFSPFSSDTTYLVNVEGKVVHTWTNEKAGDSFHLQNDGSFYRLARIPEPPNFRAGGVAGHAQHISWDGKVLWDWKMGDEKRMLHHDIKPLPNGNLLAIAWELKTPEEARAAGRRVDLIPQQGLWSEWILEIQPLPPGDARIVWEWHLWDHMVASEDAAKFPRRLDVNGDADAEKMIDEEELEQLKALGYVPDNATEEDVASDFLHMNGIDYHPRLDQIAVSVPSVGEIWILDHGTTTEEARGSIGGRYGHGGDFLYRWGNPRLYGRGEKTDKQLFAQHNVLWIPDGWTNAGHLTIFNNGGGRPDGDWSSVVEIAPPLEESGQYTLEEGKPFGPAAPVWTYQAADKASFYAPFVSGANRLQNGHTFVCAGTHGRYFEVTPEGNVVWEYKSPFHGELPGWNPPGVENFPYASFRAIKFPPDHPAFSGRTLAPLDPQPPGYTPPPRPAKQAN